MREFFLEILFSYIIGKLSNVLIFVIYKHWNLGKAEKHWLAFIIFYKLLDFVCSYLMIQNIKIKII